MRFGSVVRGGLTWTFGIVAVLAIAVVGLAAAVDAGYGHAVLVRIVAARVGRPIQVNGMLQAHLFSHHPQIVAENVTIDNPSWMPAGRAAQLGRVLMVLELPGFWHRPGIIEVHVEAATLYLARDAAGHANWQLHYPVRPRAHEDAPILRVLTVPNAHVTLNDALRHLQFVGTVSAQAPAGPGAPQPLRVQGSGQLNGRAASFELTADPLATASHDSPYQFTFIEHSSGSQVQGHGALPQPFEYDIFDATFEAAGPDLKDLYYLTGVHLIDTGDYRLTGNVSRRGKHTVFSDLFAKSGQSDMRGSVAIDFTNSRHKLDIDLRSQVLRVADLGVRAAGRTSEPKSPLLLSDTALSLNVVRDRDSQVKFRARQLLIGRVGLQTVSASATIDNGVLTLAPLSAEVLGGRLTAHLKLDARKQVPTAKVDIRITNLQLGQMPYKDPQHPAVEGPMQVRASFTGVGNSAHEVAATANGTVTTQISHGMVRDSFAELTGLDLRGLGLLLTKNKREVPIRCAIGKFTAHDGTLDVQSLIADTEPVLITATGQIHLDSETLDLDISGRPKTVRFFRLRAPVTVRGTLIHPSIGIEKGNAALEVVDRGKATDADCSALLAHAN